MVFGKKPVEEIKMAVTKVWECTSDTCNCWVRDNFKTKNISTCPICSSQMEATERELQVIHNHSVAE
ncbi:cold-inducible protein YdjO-related protein [Bacillus pinisoli]|uniref:cold-inducible protein YdjO-related protein n=1 Tax=Bacillus pinisoli TaxID=2901866 RepID=UPI001FF2475C|nr:cold-inducible protein YdjO-related protein [Bacillus pinisoli]